VNCPTQNNTCEYLWWFDSTSTDCSYNEFCGAFMYQGLQVFPDKQSCLNAIGGMPQPFQWFWIYVAIIIITVVVITGIIIVKR
jgi:hypothetical protein